MRKATGVWLLALLPLLFGCNRDLAQTRHNEMAVKSLIGKRIVDISGVDKPIVITVEGGGRLAITCHKYQLEIKTTPSK